MTPRTFWLILIKVIGVYFILNSLQLIVPFITSTLFISKEDTSSSFIELFLGFVVVAGLYFLVVRYCIFRPEFIIDKLRLDKGFGDEKIEIRIHRSTVLTIAIIVMGGIMFVEVLPILCQQLFSYIQSTGAENLLRDTHKYGWIIFYLVKLFISLFMMTSSRSVVNFIERKRRGPDTLQQTVE
jgi:hypothetical protein